MSLLSLEEAYKNDKALALIMIEECKITDLSGQDIQINKDKAICELIRQVDDLSSTQTPFGTFFNSVTQDPESLTSHSPLTTLIQRTKAFSSNQDLPAYLLVKHQDELDHDKTIIAVQTKGSVMKDLIVTHITEFSRLEEYENNKKNEIIFELAESGTLLEDANGKDKSKKEREYLIIEKDGKTPLELYMKSNERNVLNRMVTFIGCNSDIKNSKGDNILHMAINANNIKLTQNILTLRNAQTLVNELNNDKKTPFDIKNSKGDNILHMAINANNIELAQNILKFKNAATLVNEQNTDEKTPLHLAVEKSNLFAMETIVKNLEIKRIEERDADLESSNFKTWWKGWRDLMEMFCGIKDAKINLCDKKGKTPLDYAQNAEIIKILKKAGAKNGKEMKVINEAKKITKNAQGAVVKGSVESPTPYPPKSAGESKGNS